MWGRLFPANEISISEILETDQTPLEKAVKLDLVVDLFLMNKIDTAYQAAKQQLILAKSIDHLYYTGKAYYHLGNIALRRNDYKGATIFFLKSVKNVEKNKDIYFESYGDWYAALASVHSRLGQIEKANVFYKESIEWYNKKSKITSVKSTMSLGMGNTFLFLKEYDKALEYYRKALLAKKAINDKEGLAEVSLQMIQLYKELYLLKDVDLASYLKYFEFKDTHRLRQNLVEQMKSLGSYSLLFFEKKEDPYKEALSCYLLGSAQEYGSNLKEAVVLYQKGLDLSIDFNNFELMALCSGSLSRVFERQGNYQKALSTYKYYRLYNDSLFSLKSQVELGEKIAGISHKDETLRAQLEFEQFVKIKEEKEKRQRILLIVAVVALLIIGLGLYWIYVRLKLSRKQHLIIQKQHTELSFKSDQIFDSITYAKNIQKGLFPTMDSVLRIFPQSFVLFMPKDVVSGDFYWTKKVGVKSYFVLADCTGHGVPGAFVSVLGISLLNQIVSQPFSTARIMEQLHTELRQKFSLKKEESLKYGMDISVCCFDENTQELSYSGNHMRAYLLSTEGIHEFKGDRVDLGNDADVTFSEQIIPIKKQVSFYMHSDGYLDQKGGKENKKMFYKEYRRLLIDVAGKEITQQRSYLKRYFLDRKGSHEQIDDVTLVGIQLGQHNNTSKEPE